MKISISKRWRHLGLFCLIKIIESTFVYWIFRDSDFTSPTPTTDWIIIFVEDVVFTSFLVWLMIYSYKADDVLKFKEKLLLVLGLLFVNYFWSEFMNYYNIFDRIITESDLITGAKKYFNTQVLMLIISLPIIGFTKSKLKKN
ncbi:MAG: hypothetical protein KAG64_07715 [Bacteroidales bacterium]|nr:hypothetical protein [Bacteroidales bacterium]